MDEPIVREDLFYDFGKEMRIVALISGYAMFEKHDRGYNFYSLYRIFVFLFLVATGILAATGAILNIDKDFVDMLHCMAMALSTFIGTVGSVYRYIYHERLKEVFRILNTEIYSYGEGVFDEDYNRIRMENVRLVRKLTMTVQRFVYAAGFSSFVIGPLYQWYAITENTSKLVPDPYMAQLFYIPFNTRTTIGFIMGTILNIIYFNIGLSSLISLSVITMSCTGTLRAHVKIMNYSLANLEERVKFICEKTLDQSENYNICLHKCFKNNILHHMALLRFKSVFDAYTGMVFILVVFLAALITACHCLAIMQATNIFKMMVLIFTFLAEMLYTLLYCWYGERLIEESSQTYFTLYSLRWYEYDQKFKKMLSIMIINTRRPLKSASAGVSIDASLETFGSLLKENEVRVKNLDSKVRREVARRLFRGIEFHRSAAQTTKDPSKAAGMQHRGQNDGTRCYGVDGRSKTTATQEGTN